MAKPFLKGGIIALCAVPAVGGAALTAIELVQPQSSGFYIKDKNIQLNDQGAAVLTISCSDGEMHSLNRISLNIPGKLPIDYPGFIRFRGKATITFTDLSEIITKEEKQCSISFFADDEKEKPTTIGGLTISPYNPGPSPVVEDLYLDDITVNQEEPGGSGEIGNIIFKMSSPTGDPCTITDVTLYGTTEPTEGKEMCQKIDSVTVSKDTELKFVGCKEQIFGSVLGCMTYFDSSNGKKTISNLVINGWDTDKFSLDSKVVSQEYNEKDMTYSSLFQIKCNTATAHSIEVGCASLCDEKGQEIAKNNASIAIGGGAGDATLVFTSAKPLIAPISNLVLKLVIDSNAGTIIFANIGGLTVNPPKAQADYEIEDGYRDVMLDKEGFVTFHVKFNRDSSTTIKSVELWRVGEGKPFTELQGVVFAKGNNDLKFNKVPLTEVITRKTNVKMVINDDPKCTIEGLTITPAK